MAKSAPQTRTFEELLHRMTDRIRQSLELPEILDATVDEMRRFLDTDRVKVYRFHDDHSGEVVAESIKADRLPSLLGHRFPAEDIPPQAREMFLLTRQRHIVNVAKQTIGVSPLLCPKTRTPLPPHLSFRTVDPCHIDYLTAMGVQSSLVVPLLHRHQLWGLLVAHHSAPRRFSGKELELVQLIADQVAVAITHASLLQMTRQRGQREAITNQIVSILYSTAQTPLQNALEQTLGALQSAGGRLYLPQEDGAEFRLFTSGIQPMLPALSVPSAEVPILEQLPDWQRWLETEAANQSVAGVWAISNIDQAALSGLMAAALSAQDIRGLITVRLVHRERFLGYLTLFRQSIVTETVWAGRLDEGDPRQQRPRQSFETWREIKADQAHPWSVGDIGLIQDLGERFASVLYQSQLYRAVQALNADLEQRVAQRTAELQQLNESLRQENIERERALAALKQARDSLKRLSHQNNLILKSAGEGIYGIDPQGKAVFVNPAAAKILGYEKRQLIGQFMHHRLRHSQANASLYKWAQSPIFRTLRYGQTHHVSGDLFKREDGSSFPVEYVSTPIHENGKIVGAVVLFKDITERQMLESIKDEFIAVVSHELRTPLTSIRTALGLLSQKELEIPAPKRQRMVDIAFSNTNRLVRLVDDILDVERIKLGKATLTKQPCSLADILEQSADEMQAMADNHGIRLAVESQPIQLWADPDRIIQTLTNLISNAIKFSPPGSTVSVIPQLVEAATAAQVEADLSPQGQRAIHRGLEQAEQVLLLQVSDEGQGIPKSKLEVIFDRFEQLNASDVGHQGGTGLGLAICRSIVQQHSGQIWVQSTLGMGSTFYFTLPILSDAADSPNSTGGSP